MLLCVRIISFASFSWLVSLMIEHRDLSIMLTLPITAIDYTLSSHVWCLGEATRSFLLCDLSTASAFNTFGLFPSTFSSKMRFYRLSSPLRMRCIILWRHRDKRHSRNIHFSLHWLICSSHSTGYSSVNTTFRRLCLSSLDGPGFTAT